MSLLSQKILNSKTDVLKNSIINKSTSMGISVNYFIPEDDGAPYPMHYPMITSSLFMTRNSDTINPEKLGHRFKKEVRLYKSSPRDVSSNLWDLQNGRDFMSCDMGDFFYANMVPEVYNVDGYEVYTPGDYFMDRGFDETSEKDKEENVLAIVAEHESFLEVCGVGSLIYTDLSKRFRNLDNEDFCRTMIKIYPYSTSPTTHEMFKNLLEWQWAYTELGYNEYMAVMANDFLTALGLNYLDESTNEVVGSLMALPDQCLAQHIKAGECHVNEEEPECPAEFTNWCKEIMKLLELSYQYKAITSLI